MLAFIERNKQNTSSDDPKIKGEMSMVHLLSLVRFFALFFPIPCTLSPVPFLRRFS